MKSLTLGAIAVGLLGLTACNSNAPRENAAVNYEESVDNQADMFDDMAGNTSNDMIADNLANTADMMRDNAANMGDAIENGAAPPPADTNGM